MQRKMGSMLLRGALMILVAVPLAAQQKQADKGGDTVKFPLEVAFTYNAARGHTIGDTSFWMQGAGMQIEGRLTPNFGVVADVTGSRVSQIGNTGVGLALVTATFGPRYIWTPARGRYAFYGQALAGEGIGFDSVFPGPGKASSTSYNLALKLGGGANMVLAPHVALRLFEADWLRTELSNTGGNVQNDINIGAGIVIRIR